jgi:hypothetical protein
MTFTDRKRFLPDLKFTNKKTDNAAHLFASSVASAYRLSTQHISVSIQILKISEGECLINCANSFVKPGTQHGPLKP